MPDAHGSVPRGGNSAIPLGVRSRLGVVDAAGRLARRVRLAEHFFARARGRGGGAPARRVRAARDPRAAAPAASMPRPAAAPRPDRATGAGVRNNSEQRRASNRSGTREREPCLARTAPRRNRHAVASALEDLPPFARAPADRDHYDTARAARERPAAHRANRGGRAARAVARELSRAARGIGARRRSPDHAAPAR